MTGVGRLTSAGYNVSSNACSAFSHEECKACYCEKSFKKTFWNVLNIWNVFGTVLPWPVAC